MFNQNTLRIIANGDHVPDQQYIQEMARALLDRVVVYPRPEGVMRDDSKPFWYDVSKGGVVRGNIYHAFSTNTFLVEIDGSQDSWKSFSDLESAEIYAKEYLKNC